MAHNRRDILRKSGLFGLTLAASMVPGSDAFGVKQIERKNYQEVTHNNEPYSTLVAYNKPDIQVDNITASYTPVHSSESFAPHVLKWHKNGNALQNALYDPKGGGDASVALGGSFNYNVIHAGSGDKGGTLELTIGPRTARHGEFTVRDQREEVIIMLDSVALGNNQYSASDVLVTPVQRGNGIIPLVVLRGKGSLSTGRAGFTIWGDVGIDGNYNPTSQGATPLILRGDNSYLEYEVLRNGKVVQRRNPAFKSD